ncbi:hypothetical protein [Brevibacillus sp. FIR094]|uniref:hypothetical protein n=1 Tax=Brevibacillus sp. FIR094 TaxID=3134809 RepID=UPI003D1C4C36
MFYEKLNNIYRNTDCSKLFPETLVHNLELFVKNSLNAGYSFINPYRFAFEFNLSTRDSLKFFMYFTDTDGIFNISLFIECSTPACVSQQIFINNQLLQEEGVDHILFCQECDKDYEIEEIFPYIKTYFTLNPDADKLLHKENNDPNSTYETFKGLPDNLKPLSPSSLASIDGGAPTLEEVIESNVNAAGEPISSEVARIEATISPTSKLTQLIKGRGLK